jgi:hypothetical protein
VGARGGVGQGGGGGSALEWWVNDGGGEEAMARWCSKAAVKFGDRGGRREVLQLEEKPREVRGHLAKEKGGAWVELTMGGDGSDDSLNAVRSSGSSVTDVDER